MNVFIRKMQQGDIAKIMEIESVSFGNYHWSEASFASEIKSQYGHYFTMMEKDTDKLIGYCGFWEIFDEAHVTTIAIRPEYRKRRLAEFLLQKMIETGYENALKWFTLEVRVSNIPAVRLYEKYTFDTLGRRKRYYQDNNEDALIMWTDNIFNDKFKTKFEELKKELKEETDIKVVENV